MGRGIFITGTSTDVGKTVVCRALARALCRRALIVAAVKPIESGATLVDGRLRGADGIALARACHADPRTNEVGVYCFTDPVSPHLAAARVGAVIDQTAILAFLQRQLATADVVLAEGAGGLLVPLGPDLLYGDLVAETGFGLLVVAPNALGAINGTLLTLEAARSRRIPVLGVVLSRSAPCELDNAAAIARHGHVPVLGTLPDASSDDDEALADLAETHLDLNVLLR